MGSKKTTTTKQTNKQTNKKTKTTTKKKLAQNQIVQSRVVTGSTTV